MKVGSIGSYYAPKVKRSQAGSSAVSNNNQNNPAFKADVRIMRCEVEGFGRPKQLTYNEICQMNSLLKYAATAYKNKGTDNDIIVIEPYVAENRKTKGEVFDLKITAMHKDIEKGRRKILDHRCTYTGSTDEDKRYRSLMQALADKDCLAMDTLKVPYTVYHGIANCSDEDFLPKRTVPSRADLDYAMNYAIGSLECQRIYISKDFIEIEPPKQVDHIQIPIGGW